MREEEKTYPVLKVDLDAVRTNARVVCELCAGKGIEVAGVIKFSDGDLAIAEAYSSGGCRQIASSRTVHLKRIKEEMPQIRTMLIRIPMLSETEEVAQYCDISLNSEESVLDRLNEEAAKYDKIHDVILMLDVGDRREGIMGSDRLTELAVKVENEMEHLHLLGVGSSFACASGVLPDWDNLSELAACAEQVEEAIGRELEIVSGGSSITLTLLTADKPVPQKINHLRIGGAIANPMGIRKNRGVVIEGAREDAFEIAAEIVEIADKPSAPAGARKNWAGQTIECEDRGIRRRALVALGSQDIGDPKQLIPLDEGMEIVGGSSDHTIVDVTECGKELLPGDTISFRAFYMPLLYCFATRHVNIVHQGVSTVG